MVQYGVVIYEADPVLPPEVVKQHEELPSRVEALGGKIVAGLGFEPAGGVTTVRDDVVTDGPFVEAKEVIGGYAIFEFRDKAEALAMAKEFMQLHLDHMPGWEGTCELRPMIGHGVDMNCGEVQSRAHA
jgi:hypothetical protein